MSVLDDLQKLADGNGDGKLTADDLESMKDKIPADKFDEMKKMADSNDDGKINFADLKSLDFGDIKDKIGGIFS